MHTFEFNRLHLKPGYRILDLGCGAGRHTCGVYQCHAGLVVGLDTHITDLKTARQNLQLHDHLQEHAGGCWSLMAADIRHLPFPDQSFDRVICCEVLEHIANDHAALQEAVRVLKPGHTMVLSVPRAYPERLCWALSKAYYQTAGGHIRIYTLRQIKSLMATAGIHFEQYHYAHSLHTPYWWLKCLTERLSLPSGPLQLYHRLLVWDVMRRPRLTRFIEWLLNPLLGKSLVLYGRRNDEL